MVEFSYREEGGLEQNLMNAFIGIEKIKIAR